MHSMRTAFTVLLLGVFCGCAAAPAADPLLPHDSFALPSLAVQETRRINVWLPPQYEATSQAFPVLYMPDGGLGEDFPHVVRTIDGLVRAGAIAPLLVVGIENTVRRRDLTGPTEVATDRAVAPVVGGAPAFRSFVVDELIPAVERRYRCTGQRALVGESLAGLFVLETMFERPDRFERCIAFSPSLWWNAQALLRSAPSRLEALADRPRTLWFAAADETDIAPHAAALAAVLQRGAPAALDWTFVPMPEERHHTIFRAAKERAFRAALWPAR